MRLPAVLLTAFLLTACGGTDTGTVSSSPTPGKESSPSDQAVVVDIALKDGKVVPQGDRVDVKVGQTVTLRITSDTEEEIHVHSEPDHTYEVAPGEDVDESFTIDKPGQVAVEAHHLGVTIVQLVVRP